MSIYGPDKETARGGIRGDLYDYVDSVARGIAMGIDGKVMLVDGSSKPVRDISFNGKKIIDLSLPDRDTDAATKGYVDSNSYITVCASAKGRLINNQYQFGFGGGSVRNIKKNGYVMLCDGVIEKVGLNGGSTNTETCIWITINGIDRTSFMKTSTQESVAWSLTPPLSITKGEVINFWPSVPKGESSNAKITTVNLLIRIIFSTL